MFLGKYKLMLGSDCKLIYGTADYHRKRLKVLESERYIRRVNRLYIKLDDKGTRLVKEFGYDYSYKCRRKEYIDRLNEIAKVAALTLDSNIDFIASWNIKDDDIFTEQSRKYLGKMIYQEKEFIVYYIANGKRKPYVSQILNDIRKLVSYKNIIIFVEDFNLIKAKRNFVFGNDSTVIINPIPENFNLMRRYEDIDFYEIIKQMYSNTEVLLSNWVKADYMTEDRTYIFFMPFIDTERLYGLNKFYNNNKNIIRKIDIITLKENKEKIEEILTNKTNIVEMDEWLGGIDGERQEK